MAERRKCVILFVECNSAFVQLKFDFLEHTLAILINSIEALQCTFQLFWSIFRTFSEHFGLYLLFLEKFFENIDLHIHIIIVVLFYDQFNHFLKNKIETTEQKLSIPMCKSCFPFAPTRKTTIATSSFAPHFPTRSIGNYLEKGHGPHSFPVATHLCE